MDPRVFGALALLAIAGAAPPTYDQRQDGRVNVQIDVKDVQILALVDSDVLDDYVSYDYPYDYADFTIKPRPTTGKPLANVSTSTSATEETWSAWPTRPSGSSAATLTLGQESVPATILVSVNAESQPSTTSSAQIKETRPQLPSRPADVAEPRKRCPAGFHLKSGRCFKHRFSFISPRIAMMKLGPGLLNKSQVSKTNETAENS